MSSRDSFGQRLRAIRQAAGMSITELARQVGTSRSVIYSYESDAMSPTVEQANRVLAQLGHTLVLEQRRTDGAANEESSPVGASDQSEGLDP